MKIDKSKLDKIDVFRYVQNVENTKEYFFTGEDQNILKGLKKECFLPKEKFELSIVDWLYDELYIFKTSINSFTDLEEFFFYANHSTLNNDDWVSKAENFDVKVVYLTSEKLKETINLGIEATLLESSSLKVFLEFDKIETPIWLLNSYNPLFLGFIYKKHYYYLNYNGYI
ncbi:hypothetical protein [Tenacibaculum sp. M341]|uniref:hypothetical protein n=1 Tax=Tenacibaculum sp. M341 TaxID=2530339 RepID=UPI001051EAC0|nr:hypothetical protein [Tenacibaculum sp. M341]TCI85433.1 hypothetical protein EYW44_16925 [Tenacibaculum sp. M341]